jgi:plastocyanin
VRCDHRPTATIPDHPGIVLVISFRNQDSGVVHNVAIYSDAQRTRRLFQGKLFQGVATVPYHVPALPAGTYYFQCDVHTQTMNGTLVVR